MLATSYKAVKFEGQPKTNKYRLQMTPLFESKNAESCNQFGIMQLSQDTSLLAVYKVVKTANKNE